MKLSVRLGEYAHEPSFVLSWLAPSPLLPRLIVAPSDSLTSGGGVATVDELLQGLVDDVVTVVLVSDASSATALCVPDTCKMQVDPAEKPKSCLSGKLRAPEPHRRLRTPLQWLDSAELSRGAGTSPLQIPRWAPTRLHSEDVSHWSPSPLRSWPEFAHGAGTSSLRIPLRVPTRLHSDELSQSPSSLRSWLFPLRARAGVL